MLALVVLVVGAVALFHANSAGSATAPVVPAGSTNPGTSTAPSTSGGTGTQSAPPTPKASDAVRAYLQALAAGHAGTALALTSDQPADKTFLTDAVLADSNSRAPITNINVPETSGPYVYNVTATYKLGSEDVSGLYSVVKAGNGWKVSQPFHDLNLSYLRNQTLPMFANKVAVKTDTIHVFPGSYSFTTGNKFIDFGTEHVVLVKGPLDFASMSDLKATLTAAGASAFTQTVSARLNACAKSRELAPAGCPNQVHPYSFQKVDKGSVRWKFNKSSLDNLKPRLDYENPALATADQEVEYNFFATGRESGSKTPFGPRPIKFYTTMTVNLGRQPLQVTFS